MAKQRHTHRIPMLLFAVLTCSGCAYKGAIYSSYQEGGVGIRTTAESEAPVKVHFGYGRSVAAFVPRRGGDQRTEEATALISKDYVGANINPLNAGTEPALTVDSAFITGTAAIVASAPSGSRVTVQAAPATAAQPAAGTMMFETVGSPGERIGTALTQAPGRLSENQVSLVDLRRQIDSNPRMRDKIYAAAARKMPSDFQTRYNSFVSQDESPTTAFRAAQQDYLEDQPDNSVRYEELKRALSGALEEN